MWGYKKMKAKYLVASMLGIVILSLAVYSTLNSVSNISIISVDEPNTSGGSGYGSTVGVALLIENERDGEIIHTMYKDNDLVLRNVAGIMHYMMKGVDAENSLGYEMTTGTQFTLRFDTSSNYLYPSQSKMYIGSGSTAPTYSDYKLETVEYEDFNEAIGYSVAGLQMNATFVTTFTITGSHAIREAGYGTYHTITPAGWFLLFRDVFPVINVISGDILTVSYILMFN